MRDPHPRQVADLGCLGDHRIRPSDYRLGSDHRRHRAQHDDRNLRPAGEEHEERGLHVALVADEQRALPEVVEHQGRQHQAQPREGDRRPAEVAHVRKQRLGPRDRQDDSGQCEEGDVEMTRHELKGVERRQCAQDLRVAHDAAHTGDPDDGEPQDHHRAEEPAYRRGSVALHREQSGDDDHGDGHHEFGQSRIDDLEALDGGEHRDRRSDHAVTEKQCRTKDSEGGQRGDDARTGLVRKPVDLGDQGHDPALAVIVCPHHQHDVGQRDDGHHRPEDQ